MATVVNPMGGASGVTVTVTVTVSGPGPGSADRRGFSWPQGADAAIGMVGWGLLAHGGQWWLPLHLGGQSAALLGLMAMALACRWPAAATAWRLRRGALALLAAAGGLALAAGDGRDLGLRMGPALSGQACALLLAGIAWGLWLAGARAAEAVALGVKGQAGTAGTAADGPPGARGLSGAAPLAGWAMVPMMALWPEMSRLCASASVTPAASGVLHAAAMLLPLLLWPALQAPPARAAHPMPQPAAGLQPSPGVCWLLLGLLMAGAALAGMGEGLTRLIGGLAIATAAGLASAAGPHRLGCLSHPARLALGVGLCQALAQALGPWTVLDVSLWATGAMAAGLTVAALAPRWPATLRTCAARWR